MLSMCNFGQTFAIRTTTSHLGKSWKDLKIRKNNDEPAPNSTKYQVVHLKTDANYIYNLNNPVMYAWTDDSFVLEDCLISNSEYNMFVRAP